MLFLKTFSRCSIYTFDRKITSWKTTEIFVDARAGNFAGRCKVEAMGLVESSYVPNFASFRIKHPFNVKS